MWPDGAHPLLFTESSCVYMPVAQFFPGKVLFFLFLNMEKGCGHIDMLKTFPGDTDCKYIWVCGLTSIVQA